MYIYVVVCSLRHVVLGDMINVVVRGGMGGGASLWLVIGGNDLHCD
jgi:hypothetical protein